jgi:hypothetical protein
MAHAKGKRAHEGEPVCRGVVRPNQRPKYGGDIGTAKISGMVPAADVCVRRAVGICAIGELSYRRHEDEVKQVGWKAFRGRLWLGRQGAVVNPIQNLICVVTIADVPHFRAGLLLVSIIIVFISDPRWIAYWVGPFMNGPLISPGTNATA